MEHTAEALAMTTQDPDTSSVPAVNPALLPFTLPGCLQESEDVYEFHIFAFFGKQTQVQRCFLA